MKQTLSFVSAGYGEGACVKDHMKSSRYLKQIQSCGGSSTVWPSPSIRSELDVLSYIGLATCFFRVWGCISCIRSVHFVIA